MTNFQRYVLTGPGGKKHRVDNLAQFAEQHGLRVSTLYNFASKGQIDRPHRGWRIRFHRVRLNGVSTQTYEYQKPQREDESKRRACLKCCSQFLSQWSGHRLCRKCREWAGNQSCALDI